MRAYQESLNYDDLDALSLIRVNITMIRSYAPQHNHLFMYAATS